MAPKSAHLVGVLALFLAHEHVHGLKLPLGPSARSRRLGGRGGAWRAGARVVPPAPSAASVDANSMGVGEAGVVGTCEDPLSDACDVICDDDLESCELVPVSGGRKKDRLVCRIDDKWVDLTNWRRAHPAGSHWIDAFDQRDATEVMHAFHSDKALGMLQVTSSFRFQSCWLLGRAPSRMLSTCDTFHRARSVVPANPLHTRSHSR